MRWFTALSRSSSAPGLSRSRPAPSWSARSTRRSRSRPAAPRPTRSRSPCRRARRACSRRSRSRYDSQGPNGPLGVGFALGGLSSIGRCPSDLGRDGAIRGVQLDRGDRLCLDGERLVAVAGTYGMPGSEYRTERESFARVLALGSADPADPDAGPREFQVFGRDGRIRSYGSSDDARIEAQGSRRVRLWALARVEDRSGNAMRYRYDEDNANGEFELARIDYTENAAAGLAPYASVRLVWDDAPRSRVGLLRRRRSPRPRAASPRSRPGSARSACASTASRYEANPADRPLAASRRSPCAGWAASVCPRRVFEWEQGDGGVAASSGAGTLPRQLWADSKQDGLLADVDADGRLDFVHDGNASQQPRDLAQQRRRLRARRRLAHAGRPLLAEPRHAPRAVHRRERRRSARLRALVSRRRRRPCSTETHLNTGTGWAAASASASRRRTSCGTTRTTTTASAACWST